MKTVKPIYLKESNLNLLKNNTIQGSKLFAYIKLLDLKGSEITGSNKYKGGKVIYLGGNDYIGAKVVKYPNGCFKINHINAVSN